MNTDDRGAWLPPAYEVTWENPEKFWATHPMSITEIMGQAMRRGDTDPAKVLDEIRQQVPGWRKSRQAQVF